MEFLLCTQDLGDYDNGDIIDVHPDGFAWGAGEQNGSYFEIVRLPNADVGSLDVCRSSYLFPSVSKCGLCNKLFAETDAEAHRSSDHPGSTLEDLNVSRAKNRKWVVDSQGFGSGVAEICEKVFSNNDTEIAYTTRLSTSVVVL